MARTQIKTIQKKYIDVELIKVGKYGRIATENKNTAAFFLLFVSVKLRTLNYWVDFHSICPSKTNESQIEKKQKLHENRCVT